MLGVGGPWGATGSLDHALQVSSTAQLPGEPLRRKLASMAQTRALFLLKMQPPETGKLRFFFGEFCLEIFMFLAKEGVSVPCSPVACGGGLAQC